MPMKGNDSKIVPARLGTFARFISRACATQHTTAAPHAAWPMTTHAKNTGKTPSKSTRPYGTHQYHLRTPDFCFDQQYAHNESHTCDTPLGKGEERVAFSKGKPGKPRRNAWSGSCRRQTTWQGRGFWPIFFLGGCVRNSGKGWWFARWSPRGKDGQVFSPQDIFAKCAR